MNSQTDIYIAARVFSLFYTLH